MNITWVGSPNYTPGRNAYVVDRFVIHWMSGTLAGTDAQFRKDGSRPPYNGTSAHFGVEDGTVHQYVKVSDTAWHAHNFNVNQRSIGIEHSADPFRPASDATYETSGALIALLCHQVGLTPSRDLLHRHNEYFNTGCPGTMDLDRLAQLAVTAYYAAGTDQSVAPGIPATAAIAPVAPIPVIVTFHVTVAVAAANFRTAPSLNAPVARSYPRGTMIECNASVTGDTVTANGRTSNVWYKSSLHGLFISSTVANHN